MLGRVCLRKGRVCTRRLLILLCHDDGICGRHTQPVLGLLTQVLRGQATCESLALRSALAYCKSFAFVCGIAFQRSSGRAKIVLSLIVEEGVSSKGYRSWYY